MNPEAIIELFSKAPTRAMSPEQVMAEASIPAGELKTVRRMLKRLAREGKLDRLRGHKYRLPGVVESKPAPSNEVGLGTLRVVGKTIYVDDGSDHPVLLDRPPRDVDDGALVRYEIIRRRTRERAATGRVIKVLGKPGDRKVEIVRLMTEHGLDKAFPDDVLAEADAFGDEPDPLEVERRRDVRHLPLVTIDGADAKDFDDAVCALRRESGGFTLYVAIADVAHYVTPGSPLDVEALVRGTSTYLTDRAIPMLPEQLSNNLCSLRPDVDRLCLVAEMAVDRDGRTHDAEFYRAVMRSKGRLTYDQVATALDGEPDDGCRKLLPELLRLSKVATALLKRRLKRGAVDLDLREAVVVFGDDGFPTDAIQRERNDAHRLIEDLMLAANEAVARYMAERGLPTLYRVHEDPDREKLEAFAELMGQLGMGVKLKKKIHPRDVAAMVDELSEHESARYFQGLLLRAMAQARYECENKGHFGLAAERYVHFTSPIRRYPDLMVHRLLMAAIENRRARYKKSELRTIAEECSDLERKAMKAERASMDLDRALVASNHIGEHLRGTITGIQNFGVFVQIEKPFVEGMIPLRSIGDDYYESDEIGSVLRGSRTGRVFRLGQSLDVEIAHVNLDKRRVEMSLVEDESEGSKKPDRSGPPPRRRGRKRRGEDRRATGDKPKGRKPRKRR